MLSKITTKIAEKKVSERDLFCNTKSPGAERGCFRPINIDLIRKFVSAEQFNYYCLLLAEHYDDEERLNFYSSHAGETSFDKALPRDKFGNVENTTTYVLMGSWKEILS